MRQQIKEFMTFLGMVLLGAFVLGLFSFVCLSTYDPKAIHAVPLQNRIIDAVREYVVSHLMLYSIALYSAGWLSLAAWSIFKKETKNDEKSVVKGSETAETK